MQQPAYSPYLIKDLIEISFFLRGGKYFSDWVSFGVSLLLIALRERI